MNEWFGDLTGKVIVGVVTPIVLGVLLWVYKKWLKPFADLMARLSNLASDVAAIKKEMQPNSGTSLKDQVASVQRDVVSIQNTVSLMDARQRGLIGSLPRATFETDDKFNWTYANGAMERLTGVGLDRLSRRRWVSLIQEDDRDEVMREIYHMVEDRRGATVSFNFVVDDQPVPVRMEVSPVFASGPGDKVLCWSGSIVRFDERRHEERRSSS